MAGLPALLIFKRPSHLAKGATVAKDV